VFHGYFSFSFVFRPRFFLVVEALRRHLCFAGKHQKLLGKSPRPFDSTWLVRDVCRNRSFVDIFSLMCCVIRSVPLFFVVKVTKKKSCDRMSCAVIRHKDIAFYFVIRALVLLLFMKLFGIGRPMLRVTASIPAVLGAEVR